MHTQSCISRNHYPLSARDIFRNHFVQRHVLMQCSEALKSYENLSTQCAPLPAHLCGAPSVSKAFALKADASSTRSRPSEDRISSPLYNCCLNCVDYSRTYFSLLDSICLSVLSRWTYAWVCSNIYTYIYIYIYIHICIHIVSLSFSLSLYIYIYIYICIIRLFDFKPNVDTPYMYRIITYVCVYIYIYIYIFI